MNPMHGRWYQLYTHQTDPEKAIEPAIAALGIPYRFQHRLPSPLSNFFPDFAVLDRGLDKPGIIIEVDGSSHDSPAAQAADAERTAKMEAEGWVVVRCRNEEAIADPYGTVDRLMFEARGDD